MGSFFFPQSLFSVSLQYTSSAWSFLGIFGIRRTGSLEAEHTRASSIHIQHGGFGLVFMGEFVLQATSVTIECML